jgi:iron complex outermembrane receptor protein
VRQGVSGSVGAGVGAYGARNLNASMSAGAGPWSLKLHASRSDIDGYRQNNYLYSRSGSAEIRFAPTSSLDFFFRASQLTDDYGMPGGVARAALAAGTMGWRSASSLSARASTDDRSYAAGVNIDFGAGGVTTLQGTLRDRSAPFESGGPFQIESKREGIQISHQIDIPAFGRKHTLSAGTGAWSAEYARYQNGRDILGSLRNGGDLNNRDGHAELLLRLTDGLTINAGLRKESYHSTRRQQRYKAVCDKQWFFLPGSGWRQIDVNCRSPSYVTEDAIYNTWRNRAGEIGMTWLITPAWTVFSSASRHFRSPNVDDLILAEDGLKPQHGQTREIGFRYQPDVRTYVSMTLFRMRIEDEIYFGPEALFGGQSVNRNYVLPTRRTGAELQWRQRLNDRWRTNVSVGYVRPKFEGVDFDLPAVPRFTASASVEWAVTPALQTVLAVRHAGSSLDGNAAENPAFPSLPSYTVYDFGANWQLDDVRLSLKVNNLFDKLYATKSYNGEIYPMPERHVTAGALWRF